MFDRHPVCKCGSLRFLYDLKLFPMSWSAVCSLCGTTAVEIKAKPPLPKPKPKTWNPLVRKWE